MKTGCEINQKIRYQPVIPRAARWQHYGFDWLCFTNEVYLKTDNLPDEQNLSLHVSRFNDIFASAATIHVGKSKPSKKSKSWLTPHERAKICTRNLPSSENPLKPTGMDRCLPWSDRGYQQGQGKSPSKGNAELR